MALLSAASTRTGFLVSAFVFGSGFGSAYPVLVAHLMKRISSERRGATFGALIGAFDIGVSDWRVECGEELTAEPPDELVALPG